MGYVVVHYLLDMASPFCMRSRVTRNCGAHSNEAGAVHREVDVGDRLMSGSGCTSSSKKLKSEPRKHHQHRHRQIIRRFIIAFQKLWNTMTLKRVFHDTGTLRNVLPHSINGFTGGKRENKDN